MVELFDPLNAYNNAAEIYAQLRYRLSSIDETIARTISVEHGCNILDIGCGTGDVTLQLAKQSRNAGKVTGIDISPSMIELAKRSANNADNTALDVEFSIGDMDDLSFEPHSFDTIVCCLAVFFSKKPANAIGSMWRILQPGGKLILATLSRNFFHPVSGVFLDLLQTECKGLEIDQPWTKYADITELQSALRDVGILRYSTFQHEDILFGLDTAEEAWAIMLGSGFRGIALNVDQDTLERVRTRLTTWVRENSINALTLGVNYTIAEKPIT